MANKNGRGMGPSKNANMVTRGKKEMVAAGGKKKEVRSYTLSQRVYKGRKI